MAVIATSYRVPFSVTPAVKPNDRQLFGNLESLRGLAALSVVAVHCTVAFALVNQSTAPVRLFLDLATGRNAVVLFFVLSGFVLSESLAHELLASPILTFITKRLFRMLPLAYAGLILSATYLHFFHDSARLSSYAAPWFLRGFYRPSNIDVQ